MKVFLLSVAFAVICAFGAEMVLTGFGQTTSESAYASSTARP